MYMYSIYYFVLRTCVLSTNHHTSMYHPSHKAVYVNDVDVLEAIGILEANQQAQQDSFATQSKKIHESISAHSTEIAELKATIAACNTLAIQTGDTVATIADATTNLEVIQKIRECGGQTKRLVPAEGCAASP